MSAMFSTYRHRPFKTHPATDRAQAIEIAKKNPKFTNPPKPREDRHFVNFALQIAAGTR
jgi:hypothetical protein